MSPLATTLLQGAVHGTVGVLAVALVCLVFRGLRPSVRAWLWRLATLKFALAAFIVVALPMLPGPEEVGPSPEPLPFDLAAGAIAPKAAEPGTPTPIPWLEIVWGAGVAVGLVRMGRHWMAAAQIRRGSTLVELGLATHPAVECPLLLGVVKPLIVLPLILDPEERPIAIAHEEAHRRRRDALWALIGTLTATAFWFNPLAAYAAKEALAASEEACDEAVLTQANVDPIRYAEMLLAYARTSRRSAGLALSTGGRSLRRRIRGLRQPRTGTAGTLLACAIVATLLLPWTAAARAPGTRDDWRDAFVRSVASLAFLPDLSQELSITAAQRAKAKAVEDRFMDGIHTLGAELIRQKKANVSDVARIRYEGAVKDRLYEESTRARLALLSPAQRKRAEELVLRRFGERALAWPTVARRIGISESRRREIAGMWEDYRDRFEAKRGQVLKEVYGEGPKHDLSRLSPAERQEFSRLQRRMPSVSGAERKRVYDRYYDLVVKSIPPSARVTSQSWANPKNQAEHQKRMEDLRQEFIRQGEALNRRIRELLSHSERKQWDATLGKPFTWPDQPHWWG